MANSYHQGFPGESHGKESACNAGDLGLILELGRSPRGGHGNPFQHSCLENLHGHRSLAGYSPPSLKELDMTERLSIAQLSSTSDRQMIPLMAESEEELKSLLMKVKDKSRDPRVSCLNPRKTSRDLLQHVSRPDSPTAVSRHIAY